jgi:dephospho-CoA kinase
VHFIGITGGIGSGKTTIARYIETLSVPLYIADEEAKSHHGIKLIKNVKVLEFQYLEQYITKRASGSNRFQ